ncbi:hypothetical protein [Paenibacillus campinasensis]|uniref:Uncharacterized protein n=1 Tax=Paenibacillus campinasensis TaxID=66347 RepID=A0A268EDL0_9BACL|nr:hypothetical protein [Paenibacillus campinasensis]PAD71170.1 hypothetical protein CHH67_25540 [Paenibacillus campinasensis]
MYLDKALQRINCKNWNVVGSNPSQSDTHLGYEFLRRLAQFFKEQSQKPVPPLYANIAKLLGDEEVVVISDYCNKEAIEFLDDQKYVGKVFGYYLQLAKYTDKNPDAQIYLDVYDPLIRIIERGGLFILKLLELDIVANLPLNGWYERFVEKEAIDIENL